MLGNLSHKDPIFHKTFCRCNPFRFLRLANNLVIHKSSTVSIAAVGFCGRIDCTLCRAFVFAACDLFEFDCSHCCSRYSPLYFFCPSTSALLSAICSAAPILPQPFSFAGSNQDHLGGGRVAGRGRWRTVHGDGVLVCCRWDKGWDMVGQGR